MAVQTCHLWPHRPDGHSLGCATSVQRLHWRDDPGHQAVGRLRRRFQSNLPLRSGLVLDLEDDKATHFREPPFAASNVRARQRLRAGRELAGKTHADVAMAVGLTHANAVASWEASDPSERAQPLARQVLRVAKLCGLPAYLLIDDAVSVEGNHFIQGALIPSRDAVARPVWSQVGRTERVTDFEFRNAHFPEKQSKRADRSLHAQGRAAARASRDGRISLRTAFRCSSTS